MCAPTTLVKHDLLGDALSGVSPTGTTNASGAKQIIEMFFINPDVSPTNAISLYEGTLTKLNENLGRLNEAFPIPIVREPVIRICSGL